MASYSFGLSCFSISDSRLHVYNVLIPPLMFDMFIHNFTHLLTQNKGKWETSPYVNICIIITQCSDLSREILHWPHDVSHDTHLSSPAVFHQFNALWCLSAPSVSVSWLIMSFMALRWASESLPAKLNKRLTASGAKRTTTAALIGIRGMAVDANGAASGRWFSYKRIITCADQKNGKPE